MMIILIDKYLSLFKTFKLEHKPIFFFKAIFESL